MATDSKPTPAELAEWERACASASPGPWYATTDGRSWDDVGNGPFVAGADGALVADLDRIDIDPPIDPAGMDEADAHFIALSRVALPRLLAAVREGEERIAGLTAAAERVTGRVNHVHDCEKINRLGGTCDCGLTSLRAAIVVAKAGA